MAPKKEWSDLEVSKIEELFPDLKAIARREPIIKLDDGSVLRAQDIRDRILDSTDMIARKPKSALLDLKRIGKSDVENLCKRLDSIRKSNQNVCVELVKIRENPIVRFWDSEVKKGKLYPPRMIIDLSKAAIQPNESVMINTGYVMRIPQAVHTRTIEKDRIVKDTHAIVKQPNFVIVPLINSPTAHLIPSIYVRDSDDTGMLTINFTLISGNPGKLQVVFNAYIVDRMTDNVQLVDPEPNAMLFKPKDGLNSRVVKNPKVKIRFSELYRAADDSEDAGSLVFPTFNPLVTPSVTYAKQRVLVDATSPLFLCSRRREWHNPELLTLSGLITSNSDFLVPRTLHVSDCLKNTHCMVMLKNRATLLSEQVPATNSMTLKLLNGAFIHLPDFKEVTNDYNRLLFASQALASGYPRCVTISEKLNVPLIRVLKIFDYHRNLNEATIGEYLTLDDPALFNSRVGSASAYSVAMRKSLIGLAKWYGASSSAIAVSPNSNGKRKSDDDDDDNDNDSFSAKKRKTE